VAGGGAPRPPRHDNLIVAAGHCMLGLGMGPVTGALVADLLAGREPALDLGPLRVDRFAELARPPRPRPIVASAT